MKATELNEKTDQKRFELIRDELSLIESKITESSNAGMKYYRHSIAHWDEARKYRRTFFLLRSNVFRRIWDRIHPVKDYFEKDGFLVSVAMNYQSLYFEWNG